MSCSYLASVSTTRDVLAHYGLTTKKSLGQHFLIDDNVISRSVEMAALEKDETVLEVGPGIGTLTVALLPRCRAVVAIERDRDMLPVLSETCAQDSDKLAVIEGDALKVEETQIEKACSGLGVNMPQKMVANLPYAVAATVILAFFERLEMLQRAIVMVQREVADRISAIPGTKSYGAYTVKLGLYATTKRRFEVSSECFFPPPRVDSTVIELVRTTPKLDCQDVSIQLIQAASLAADASFAQRRKTIRNSMTAYLAPKGLVRDDVEEILAHAHIDAGRRGETLSQEEFLRLGKELMPRLGL